MGRMEGERQREREGERERERERGREREEREKRGGERKEREKRERERAREREREREGKAHQFISSGVSDAHSTVTLAHSAGIHGNPGMCRQAGSAGGNGRSGGSTAKHFFSVFRMKEPGKSEREPRAH